MNETNYRIKYRKGDFEVDVQGDRDWVEKKFKELTEGKLVTMEKAPPKAPFEVLPASLVEFLKARGNPTEHTNIVLAFSYWLSKKKGFDSYNVKDIEDCYLEARISRTTNTHQMMNENQRKGYLMPVSKKKDGKKAWIITQTGEDFVEKNFKQ